ncbi:MAG: replication endonuclease [Aquabacterium sp.]|uniref:replication endonuclease n=1 Tax=Aquabacterium sp. TaxID=1872578 RepID=UPI00121B7C01|nr:replication endonuclease [Aquabacterium sp.]TAK86602.1 MAG: replication endonuclease [Aquabacterium sp.]
MQLMVKNLKTLADYASAFDLADDAIRDTAERAASSVQRLANTWQGQGTSDEVVLKTLRQIARGHCVSLPSKDGFKQWMNRMTDAGWWRRALRERFRAVELHQIRKGAVHRQAGAYVSAKALRRFERDRRRLAALLASLDVVNQQTGEVISLQDIADASLANPSNRRKAMMARIKGIEAHAKAQGHKALFLTITCPSRMHPRHVTGERNERHDGTSPRRAQAYLGRLWNSAMRQAAHQGLKPYGLRVVEPHHDACPHWHVLVFVPADQAEVVTGIFRAYALADSPNEPGAQERRFTVEHIDPTKGSALGYVAKYVSKSIDGEGLDSDEESDHSGANASRRIVAWSRTWGIRQFQFFGVPTITPMRELYRMDEGSLPSQALREAHQACKANDHAAWMNVCATHGLCFKVHYSERPSTRYAEETTRAIHGLCVRGADLPDVLELVTRSETWRIEPRKKKHEAQGEGAGSVPAPAFPWTRFNNSASIDFKGFLDGVPLQSGFMAVDGQQPGEWRAGTAVNRGERMAVQHSFGSQS